MALICCCRYRSELCQTVPIDARLVMRTVHKQHSCRWLNMLGEMRDDSSAKFVGRDSGEREARETDLIRFRTWLVLGSRSWILKSTPNNHGGNHQWKLAALAEHKDQRSQDHCLPYSKLGHKPLTSICRQNTSCHGYLSTRIVLCSLSKGFSCPHRKESFKTPCRHLISFARSKWWRTERVRRTFRSISTSLKTGDTPEVEIIF